MFGDLKYYLAYSQKIQTVLPSSVNVTQLESPKRRELQWETVASDLGKPGEHFLTSD